MVEYFMLHVALFEPEIAGNVGNIARTCLASGARLHLIRPFAFRLTDKALERSAMDYWHEVDVHIHTGYQAFCEAFAGHYREQRVFSLSTKAERNYSDEGFRDEDVLLFGPESRGLPPSILASTCPLRLPMRPQTRSLNLANSVAITVYEAWRQLGFAGGS